jgi:hypothetical protein
MRLSKYPLPDRENLAFIYSGLGSVSNRGREYLKNLAQYLLAMQNRPGTPIPEGICQEIIRNKTDDLL